MLSTVKSEADEIVNKSTETLSKVIFAERGYHHAKALATHKKQAKQLELQQRDFDVVVKDLKRLQSIFPRMLMWLLNSKLSQ